MFNFILGTAPGDRSDIAFLTLRGESRPADAGHQYTVRRDWFLLAVCRDEAGTALAVFGDQRYSQSLGKMAHDIEALLQMQKLGPEDTRFKTRSPGWCCR